MAPVDSLWDLPGPPNAIEVAAFWRDLGLDLANTAYDDDVADAADTRASEHTTHLADYDADEAAAWQELQSDLTSSAQTHSSDVAAAKAAGDVALDAAWDAYDLVAEDSLSTPSQKDAALAARLIAVAAALAKYNNDIATAEARQTDDDVDSWAVYDIAVNGFLTTYWNAEAVSDSKQTHAVNAAYVTWANDKEDAWADYSNDVADARGQQTLDDVQSANEAWHDINLATGIWYTDNADALNDYNDDVVPLESDYYTDVESTWVDYVKTTNAAESTQVIALAYNNAAAMRRWADVLESTGEMYAAIWATYVADLADATAERAESVLHAEDEFEKLKLDAGSDWLETVLPAWVTYEDEVSDHTVDWVDTSSTAWETRENDIADADLDYTTAAVPVGTRLSALKLPLVLPHPGRPKAANLGHPGPPCGLSV